MYYMLYVFIPSLLLVLITQGLISSQYRKYGRIQNSRRITGAQAAEAVLRANGVYDVAIQCIEGRLTDNYNPRTNTISLSRDIFYGDSIAAVGIACHEAGHAMQYAEGYGPIKLRTAIIPITNFGSAFGVLLIILGLVINMLTIAWAGVILFGAVVVFQLVTLPVEFNASSRAIRNIEASGLLSAEELSGAKKVLTAAALTYVAALLQSLLTLVYYITQINGRRR
ncbi:MAG TPA: zinc metallopeptidase [Firmicutes bacterium]|nr:zinc metallopeptidase [Bacillota bacterium]